MCRYGGLHCDRTVLVRSTRDISGKEASVFFLNFQISNQASHVSLEPSFLRAKVPPTYRDSGYIIDHKPIGICYRAL